jgi:MATE family multidrug resistance protein
MFLTVARGLIAHAFPILIAQLSSIGMMVIDTAVLGHVSALDLAAVAIGGGIHVALVFALAGVLQAVGPVVAHLHGARRDGEVAGVLHQGFWLAMLLSVPGVLFLLHPDALLGMAEMDAAVDAKVRQYLAILAWSLPAALAYRTFYAFCNALGKPRVLMGIGLVSLGIHAVLARGLALEGWLGEPLGVAGCALSNVMIGWAACLSGAAYLAWGPLRATYRPFADWAAAALAGGWRELLRIGLPMGFSNLVEITSFTLISLFIASLGATGRRRASHCRQPVGADLHAAAVAGHRHHGGTRPGGRRARPGLRARATIRAGLLLSAGLSSLIGPAALAGRRTADRRLHRRSGGAYACGRRADRLHRLYQFFDALQTVAGHCLRAYRVTFVPMLVQTFCFWGIGLLGGAWLCYRWQPPLGVAGSGWPRWSAWYWPPGCYCRCCA